MRSVRIGITCRGVRRADRRSFLGSDSFGKPTPSYPFSRNLTPVFDPPCIPPTRVLEAESFVEAWGVGAMECGGEDEPVGAMIGGPALDDTDERAADSLSSHLRRDDERRELHDGVRVVED